MRGRGTAHAKVFADDLLDQAPERDDESFKIFNTNNS